eukprot:SAG11_NODE_5040_length_1682_cov_2.234997_4_plen_115_part_00
MAADLLVRGGTVVDGSGEPKFVGDVAIKDGKISAVGPDLGQTTAAAREIDATGLLVAPGWCDTHTHYDGQATWDEFLTPSSYHGVTTTVFGNWCALQRSPKNRMGEVSESLWYI